MKSNEPFIVKFGSFGSKRFAIATKSVVFIIVVALFGLREPDFRLAASAGVAGSVKSEKE
jgi:hypothetical protein